MTSIIIWNWREDSEETLVQESALMIVCYVYKQLINEFLDRWQPQGDLEMTTSRWDRVHVEILN